MALKLTNNATSTLAGSIAAGDTAIAIASGDAGKFPSLGAGDWFPMTIIDGASNLEIVKVTARTGGTLTVARGQEGTAARAFAAGSRADLRLTSAALAAFASAESVAALSSAVSTKAEQADLATVAAAAAAKLPLAGGMMSGDLNLGWNKLLRVASLNGGPLGGMRNKIINGDFAIAQRATSQATQGILSIDRWMMGTGTGTVASMQQSTFSPGSLLPGNDMSVSEDPTFCNINITNAGDAANGYCYLEQRIEDVRTLNGKLSTITMWVYSNVGGNVGIVPYQWFGTGGAPSSLVGLPQKQVNLTANTWTKITHTLTVPSVNGKVLGTNNDHALAFRYTMSDLTQGQKVGNFMITHVSWVEGDATQEVDPFSKRPPALELMLCRRYYERTPRWTTQQFKNASNNMYDHDKWQVTKRVVPTIAAIFWNNVNCSVPTFVPTVDGVIMYATKDGTSGEASVQWEIAAGAELT